MNKTTTTTNQGVNAFATLIRNYELQARQRTPKTEVDFMNALQELAKACTYSVLKKLCNVGGYVNEDNNTSTDTTKTIRALRQCIARDTSILNNIVYASNNSKALEYNTNGELISVIKNKELYEALNDLNKHTLGDGLDLVNTAILAILSESSKITDLSTDFMEVSYTIRRLNKKVHIKEVDSIGGYEIATTTAIQEVFKAIRRDIENNGAVQVANNKYTYIADITTDTDTDTVTNTYRRLPKFSGLASEVMDFNGKIAGITADTQSVKDTDHLIALMNLTAKQAKVLQLRECGYGQKAIATYLGVTKQAIQKTLKQIQIKAISIGLTPNK